MSVCSTVMPVWVRRVLMIIGGQWLITKVPTSLCSTLPWLEGQKKQNVNNWSKTVTRWQLQACHCETSRAPSHPWLAAYRPVCATRTLSLNPWWSSPLSLLNSRRRTTNVKSPVSLCQGSKWSLGPPPLPLRLCVCVCETAVPPVNPLSSLSAAHECPQDDVSVLIPVVVAAALAGLIVIVVAAYIVGRRKTHAGYQTL